MGIFIKSVILHTLKFQMHSLSCHFWLNLCLNQCWLRSMTPYGITRPHWVNSLKFLYLILQTISVNDGWGIACGLALRWMSLDCTDDKSTLVQVMAWCRQATSHYLSQCWPRSLSPYGVTRPRWVKTIPINYPHHYWQFFPCASTNYHHNEDIGNFKSPSLIKFDVKLTAELNWRAPFLTHYV